MKKVVITIIIVVCAIVAAGIYCFGNVNVKDSNVRSFEFPHESKRYTEKMDQGDGTFLWTDSFTPLYDDAYGASVTLKGQITKGKITVMISGVSDTTGEIKSTQEITFVAPMTIDHTVTVKGFAGRAHFDVIYDDESEGSFTAEWTEDIIRYRKWFSATQRAE